MFPRPLLLSFLFHIDHPPPSLPHFFVRLFNCFVPRPPPFPNPFLSRLRFVPSRLVLLPIPSYLRRLSPFPPIRFNSLASLRFVSRFHLLHTFSLLFVVVSSLSSPLFLTLLLPMSLLFVFSSSLAAFFHPSPYSSPSFCS